ncbi:MAG TPA: ATP-grasp domain-containing protein [Micromonosporaceae bacterium]|nr:ATP-grasp domain-containing protein [Micromonosporaceae bacterium]
MMLLLPADPLRLRRPDEHFAPEAAAARAAGFTVALVDHDALIRDRAEQAVSTVPAGGTAIYRGWMMRSEQYAAFAQALARRDVTLRTTADQYRRAHELPGWYSTLAELTPRSAWTTGDDRADFDRVRAVLGAGPAVLRDYTKSMKHYWHEATYIPDLADGEAAWKIASRFRDLRGDDFVGGFVVRCFEEFSSAEARTWWVNGTCVLTGPHPDTPDDSPPDVDLASLVPLVAALDLPFVTVDLARHVDGRWRVVELGDGQVSDRPATIDADTLITALLAGS